MALSAKLYFGNNQIGAYSQQYDVVECKYRFNRQYNYYHPSSDAQCDNIKLTIVAPNMADLNLYEWYINQSILSGKITFELMPDATIELAQSKEIVFEDAACYSIEEDYHIDRNQQRLLTLEISAKEVVINKIKFERYDDKQNI